MLSQFIYKKQHNVFVYTSKLIRNLIAMLHQSFYYQPLGKGDMSSQALSSYAQYKSKRYKEVPFITSGLVRIIFLVKFQRE
jgi:hypothetical protein